VEERTIRVFARQSAAADRSREKDTMPQKRPDELL
jgi:hypothetical protein